MIVVEKKLELIDLISQFRRENKLSVGFVPTMGFLHSGHGSLIDKSLNENGLTVCDIFINPLQFNDKSDFENYPVDIQKDREYLESLGCNVLYIPHHSEIYPEWHIPMNYDFGLLETVMEGKYRPGHFQGVAEVVRILLEIVSPDKAYFGEKDYQQLKIIEFMVNKFQFPVEIVPCSIVREHDGLAMSSRNARLNKEQRVIASFIYRQLLWCTHHFQQFSPVELKSHIIDSFIKHPDFKLEYIEFADRESLKIIENWSEAKTAGVFIAAWLGNVRLIDNMLIF
jgi:pantoate--beta-alanine ligase